MISFFYLFIAIHSVPELVTLCLISKIGIMSRTLHAPEYRKLIEWLKAARLGHSLTMRELASELGVPHSYVRKVEPCERKLDVLEYLRYCQALDLNLENGIAILS